MSPTELRCTKCHRVWPVEHFSKSPLYRCGYMLTCRACKTAYARRYRAAKREDRPDDSVEWRRLSTVVLHRLIGKLVVAARAARRTGLWRGRDAIRAYRDLGIALDALGVPRPAPEEIAMTEPVWPRSSPEAH